MIGNHKKLIEVALPLEAINVASAREKSIRHGHPSTLHLWWARRPLAAARAVIFSQMVDDPAEYLSDEKEISRERDRLFALIEELVLWENTTNEKLLERARAEIRRSWARQCLSKDEGGKLKAEAGKGGTCVSDPVAGMTDREIARRLEAGELPPLPGFHDPFAGGGALPLEAQRLGLEAYASDLNPVAVLINKAMIEIPPKFAGLPPINPESRRSQLGTKTWKGAQGLAEDVRYYGQWMRDEAFKRIGDLYPPVKVVQEKDGTYRHAAAAELQSAIDNPQSKIENRTVIAWIWARTVKSSNPAFSHAEVPLISTYVLSSKAGHEAWLEPMIDGDHYRFEVRHGKFPAAAADGTKLGRGGGLNFSCILSGTPMDLDYIRDEGRAGRMGARLIAIVAEGDRGRIYLPATPEHERIAESAKPEWAPSVELPHNPRDFKTPLYGMKTFADLFTPRQLVALTTFSDLVGEARERVRRDAESATTLPDDDRPVNDGGNGATAYADAVATYLGFAVNKATQRNCELCTWEAAMGRLGGAFGRQAIPMTWDYAETNPFAGAGGDIFGTAWSLCEVLDNLLDDVEGFVHQDNATLQQTSSGKVVSTDPPYYDNIGYADLSDFFYVWLRKSLRGIYPELFATMTVPKAEELVATPYRHGGKDAAEAFFMAGMTRAIHNLAVHTNPAFPVTIYYAFKQSETSKEGTASTGWETFLEAVLVAGFAVVGTWPMRTELIVALKKRFGVLASSVVLVCRRRAASAGVTTRREFQAQLHRELPGALRALQHGNIAPVDLAQSSIGPGMAIFSRYSKVVEADGSPMKVRTALALINESLDGILAEQEGELDAETRWAVAWYTEYGTGEGPFGRADDLSRAKATSVQGLADAGVVHAKAGKVNLLRREELDADWDPSKDKRLTVWEAAQHLIRRLEHDGEGAAADLLGRLGGVAEQARDLAYRLYVLCERKGWAEEARSYNGLVVAWPELARLAAEIAASRPPVMRQTELGI